LLDFSSENLETGSGEYVAEGLVRPEVERGSRASISSRAVKGEAGEKLSAPRDRAVLVVE
jgi:hypothetical protein